MPDPSMRDGLTQLFERRMSDLSGKLADGSISVGDWQITMRQELRDVHALQLIAAAGGDKANVDPNDWLKLGSELQKQYRYLEDFAHDIQDGNVVGGAINVRAEMYARSGKISYWKQITRGANLPTMPGEQQCLGNCGCEWVDNFDGSWTWKRGKTDSCGDCLGNELTYNPYWPDGAMEKAA